MGDRARWAALCLECGERYVRWSRYFCTQRCAAGYGRDRAYEDGFSWNPEERRWEGWATEEEVT